MLQLDSMILGGFAVKEPRVTTTPLGDQAAPSSASASASSPNASSPSPNAKLVTVSLSDVRAQMDHLDWEFEQLTFPYILGDGTAVACLTGMIIELKVRLSVYTYVYLC